MLVAGIICEYNPFHNGHLYQIQQLKTEYGIDAVICAMSGHFMQRGEPAIVHKLDRTNMALNAGADLVLELPALFATRSAYWFALGGVSLLAGTGIVTHLAFGAESNDLPALEKTAAFLAKPGQAFEAALKTRLKEGLSFVEAQGAALKDRFNALVPTAPNDRLALCYLQIIAERKYSLKPILIPRKKAGYHDLQPVAGSNFASANAIRSMLASASSPQEGLQEIQSYIPEASLSILQNIISPQTNTPEPVYSSRLVFTSDLSDILLALLRRTDIKELKTLPDMTEGLENRIKYCALHSSNINDFYRQLKTKRYNLTRLQRTLLHLFLNYKEELASQIDLGCPYIRILGCTAKGRQLLSAIKANSNLPIISRSNQMKNICRSNKAAANAWQLDVRSGDLYAWLQKEKIQGSPEYKLQPIVPDNKLI